MKKHFRRKLFGFFVECLQRATNVKKSFNLFVDFSESVSNQMYLLNLLMTSVTGVLRNFSYLSTGRRLEQIGHFATSIA